MAAESIVILGNDSIDIPDEFRLSPSHHYLHNQHESLSKCSECRHLSVQMAEAKLDIEILRVSLNKLQESLGKLEDSSRKSVQVTQEISTQTAQLLEPTHPPNSLGNGNSLMFLDYPIQEESIHNSKTFAKQIQDELRKKQHETTYTASNTLHIDTCIGPQVDRLMSEDSPLSQFVNKRAIHLA